jgi:hypothetical protein
LADLAVLFDSSSSLLFPDLLLPFLFDDFASLSGLGSGLVFFAQVDTVVLNVRLP